MDYVSLSAGNGFEREVWAQANQYSLTPGVNRLVLVRDADQLTRWEQLSVWLSRTRSLPGVYLLFVGGQDLPTVGTGSKKTLKPHVAALKAPRGYVVRATMPAESDAIAWLMTRCPITETVARHLLTRTGGDLGEAAAVTAKLALFEQTTGTATVDALVAEGPATNFTDNLIAGNKRHAMISLEALRADDHISLIALLDSRLDLLHKLHRIQISGQSWREATGINPFLQRQYLPHARGYDAASCARRRQALALADHATRTGARHGVLEALVALW
jgi:DNA polymerase III delta subunit